MNVIKSAKSLLKKLGYTGTENPTEMTHFVRGYVRERFLKADVGVNGCNFAVAASGTCTIVSNEGNGRMASSIPKTQSNLLEVQNVSFLTSKLLT